MQTSLPIWKTGFATLLNSRDIPQGNDVSSFFGNLYVVPLDRALNAFCKKCDAKWFRYVDDVKVFTKSEHDAREAVFVINDALRALHLQRFIRDKEFARQELARMRKGSKTDSAFQRNVHRLFALSATGEADIAAETHDFVAALPATKSKKIRWLRDSVLGLTEWAKASESVG